MISVLLTKEHDAVELHLDKEGLENMIQFLELLKGKQEHTHLMTPECGAGETLPNGQGELSSEQLKPDFITLDMLTIYSWPEGVGTE
jgi:hypothetical protein